MSVGTGHLWRRRAGYYGLGLAILLGITGLVAACATETPTATFVPTATVPAVPTATPEDHDHDDGDGEGDAEAGYAVFVAAGCSACHGADAEGTSIAPALAGHSEAQVRSQVREPVGLMPVFSLDQVSEADLVNLAAYITGLDGEHTH